MKKEIVCGIYIWINIINNKKYVGCSKNIYNRWQGHIKNCNDGIKRKFYNAIRKYGENNFKKEIILICDINISDIELKKHEDYYIDFYDSINTGYNIEKGYNTISHNPNKEIIVKNISDKAKLRKWINNGEKNITVCPEKINEYLENGWNLGRLPFSIEHKKQLSESHKDIHLTEETREKLRKLWTGRHHTEEMKKDLSIKTKGRYTMKWYIDKYGEIEGEIKYKNHHNRNKK